MAEQLDRIEVRELRVPCHIGTTEAERARLVAEYNDAIVNPWEAADRGFVDAVIAPSETRAQVVQALRALRTKRAALPAKKHGNIPL